MILGVDFEKVRENLKEVDKIFKTLVLQWAENKYFTELALLLEESVRFPSYHEQICELHREKMEVFSNLILQWRSL